ncbi:MAG: energy transducer TonB, partial [Sphingomonadales bacterium]|nr:energy transducer TonB [Sphingomonadales bacterium]
SGTNGSAPGSGAGGPGAGSGAGGEGAGDGDGGSDPELVGGRIKSSDTPAALRQAPLAVTTSSLVSIDADGRVTDCRPHARSGSAVLDVLTCQLIRERFRFRPARDANGQPVPGRIIYEHDWEVGGGFDAPPGQDEGDGPP